MYHLTCYASIHYLPVTQSVTQSVTQLVIHYYYWSDSRYLLTTIEHVKKFKQEIRGADKEGSIEKHDDRMMKRDVWDSVPVDLVSKGAKVITSTCAKKIKPVVFRGKIKDFSKFMDIIMMEPVTNEAPIMVVMVLALIFGFSMELLGLQGTNETEV